MHSQEGAHGQSGIKASMIPRFLERSGWTGHHLAAAVLLALSGMAVTWRAWADMLRIAHDDQEMSHIFLVPIVAIWIVWVRRTRLRQCRPRGSMLGPVVMGLGWLMSWYGYGNAIQWFWHAGSVLIVVGGILAVMGRDLLLRFLPAFLVLVFLVPIPGAIRSMSLPLQTATAVVTQSIFEVAGVPVEQAGNTLTINGHMVHIIEACNGMRLVFTLMLVSYTFAFITPLRNYVRLVILLASPVLAIICNVIRLVPTVYIHGQGNKEFAEQFHDVSAWVMIGVAFGMLLGIVRLLQWAMVPIGKYNLAQD